MDGAHFQEFQRLLKIACNEEKVFIEIVKKESGNIPLPVKMFLADKIRNAVAELDDKRSQTITEALAVVGI